MLRKYLSFAVILACLTISAYAQTTEATGLKLGKVSVMPTTAGTKISSNATGTREDILAEPRINIAQVINGHKCKVSSFQISMKLTGGDYFGPFAVQGAELPPNVIQKLVEMPDPQGMVYVETIKIYDEVDKKEITLSPIIMKMVKK